MLNRQLAVQKKVNWTLWKKSDREESKILCKAEVRKKKEERNSRTYGNIEITKKMTPCHIIVK